jgi:branched-chain amino acid transport system permease protein
VSSAIAGNLRRIRRVVSPGSVTLVAVIALLSAWPYLGASRFMLHLGSLFFVWAVVASYWNLLNGYAGIISLGNMGFFAVGAYTSAVMAKELAISPWITIWVGAVVAMVLVTVFLGLPVLRLRGIYIALLTLVFADALPSVISILHDWTGGGIGLLGIPEFLEDLEKWQGYYLTLAFAIVALGALYRIVHGKTGMAFVALRDSEAFAVALGVDRFREGVKVFAISAFVTGMAGGFFAHTLGQISPGMLGIEQFLMVVAMWLLGGAGTFFGPIIGAAIITFGNEYLRVAGSVRLGLLGGLIMVTVLFFPGGIMQIAGRLGEGLRRGGPRMRAPSAGTPREAVPAPVVEDVPAGASVDRGTAAVPDREE